jgi:hypothetical protein
VVAVCCGQVKVKVAKTSSTYIWSGLPTLSDLEQISVYLLSPKGSEIVHSRGGVRDDMCPLLTQLDFRTTSCAI